MSSNKIDRQLKNKTKYSNFHRKNKYTRNIIKSKNFSTHMYEAEIMQFILYFEKNV